MKLSDLKVQAARIKTITALKDTRDVAHSHLVSIDEGADPEVGDGYDSVTISGAGVKHVKDALRQQILDIETELTALGVVVDEPPNFENEDDDAANDDDSEAA